MRKNRIRTVVLCVQDERNSCNVVAMAVAGKFVGSVVAVVVFVVGDDMFIAVVIVAGCFIWHVWNWNMHRPLSGFVETVRKP